VMFWPRTDCIERGFLDIPLSMIGKGYTNYQIDQQKQPSCVGFFAIVQRPRNFTLRQVDLIWRHTWRLWMSWFSV
jgi:hypothetical protein